MGDSRVVRPSSRGLALPFIDSELPLNLELTRRDLLKIAGYGSLAAFLAACGGGSAPTSSSKPFNLLLMTSDTGPAASFGPAYEAGYHAAIDHVNSHGGLLGRPLKATIRDDGTDTSRAVTIVQSEITNNRPDFVHNGISNTNGPGITPLLTREKIISVQAAQNLVMNDQEKFPYYFSNGLVATTYAVAAAGYLKSLGAKTVGILASTDGTGTSSLGAAQPAFKDAGIQVVDVERYTTTDLDMTSQLRKLDAAKPDYLFLSMGLAGPAGFIMQGIDRLGITRPLLGDIGTSGGLNENATSFPKSASLAKLQLVSYAVQARGTGGRASLPEVAAAIATFKEYENGNITNPQISTLAYDSILTWVTAVTQAQSADADKVKKVLEGWGQKPASGFLTWDTMSFTPTNHFNKGSGSNNIAIVQAGTLDNNSTRQIVAPVTIP